jgi:hypothetical protein
MKISQEIRDVAGGRKNGSKIRGIYRTRERDL